MTTAPIAPRHRPRRIAVIYDNTARADTTGGHCQRALESLGHAVSHYLPGEVEQIPTIYDLYLRVDDDLEAALPHHLRPAAFWAIDTHRDYPRRLAWTRGVEYAFCAQRDAAARMRADGVASIFWLPLACDAGIHRRIPGVPKRYDLCFVGNSFPGDGERSRLLEWIRRSYPASFVGTAYGDQMAEIYTASRLVFNCAIRNDINMRVFEAAGCGSLLLTNDLAANGQDLLFTPGTHLVTYASAGELSALVPRYLADETERERIAEAGMRHAHAHHTYRHRMADLLAVVFDGMSLDAKYPIAPRGSHAANPDAAAGGRRGGNAGVQGSTGAQGDPSRSPDLESAPGKLVALAGGRQPFAVEASGSGRPKVSIVIPCFNQLALTQQCVTSIRRYTDVAYEVIIVDNGSTDGTAAWARSEGLRVIANAENLGFPRACNQGVLAADGEYLLLLNNDTIVSPGWLGRLLGYAEVDASVGLVGPSTNFAGGCQRIQASYASHEEFLEFAAGIAREEAGRGQAVSLLIGLCLLIPRRVVQAVGLLDERFGLGNFEDNDYCLRVRMAGFRLVWAKDVFIHHEGHRTFRQLGDGFEKLLECNGRLYQEKWELGRYLGPQIQSEGAPAPGNTAGDGDGSHATGARGVSGAAGEAADAWGLLKSGRYLEAYEAFERIVRTEPRNVRAFLGLGLAAEGRLVPAAAALAYQAALGLAPGDPDAARGLQRVRQQVAVQVGGSGANGREMQSLPARGQAPAEPPPGYFEHARPEVQALVPSTARRILDVGCGAGRLGAALKAAGSREVVGIEIDPQQASRARERLDHVLVGDAETIDLPFPQGAFDCIICSDVLEHLREPWAFLGRLRGYLKPGGSLVVSIPNVQFLQVIRDLASGRWTYQPAGILDRTHLRFFTRREFRRALRRAAFTDVAWHPRIPEALSALAARDGGQPVDLTVGSVRISGIQSQDLQDFLAIQYLVVAQPSGPQESVAETDPDDETSCSVSVRPSAASEAPPQLPPAARGSDGAWQLLRAGEYVAAYEAFEAVVRTEPRNVRALLGLGLSAEGRGVPTAAALAYRTALDLDPGDSDAYRGLARVTAQAKER